MSISIELNKFVRVVVIIIAYYGINSQFIFIAGIVFKTVCMFVLNLLL